MPSSGALLASPLMSFGRPWQPVRQRNGGKSRVCRLCLLSCYFETNFERFLDGFADLLGLRFRLSSMYFLRSFVIIFSLEFSVTSMKC